MQTKKNTKFRNFLLVKKSALTLSAGLSLSFACLACQTTSPKKQEIASKSEIEKKMLESQLALVQSSLDSGQPEKSHGLLREALQKFPDNPQLNNYMGLTQLALKNPKRAVIHFEKSYRTMPEIGVGLNLSSALIDNGDYKNALIKLHTLVKESKQKNYPFQERIYHNIGYTLVKLKKYRNAEKWLKLALEENPTFFPTHLELARLYLRQSRLEEAVISLKRSHDYCLPCWEPIELLTKLYLGKKQYKEANILLVSYLKTPDIAEGSKVLGHQLLQEVLTAQSVVAKTPLPISAHPQ